MNKKKLIQILVDEELDRKITEGSEKYGISKVGFMRMIANSYFDQQDAIKAMREGQTFVDQLAGLQAEIQKVRDKETIKRKG